MVEALKSICGISIVSSYSQYMEYNIRKYQGIHVSKEAAESTRLFNVSSSTSTVNLIDTNTDEDSSAVENFTDERDIIETVLRREDKEQL